MSKKRTKDIGASVRQRLLNLARSSNRPFNEVLQYGYLLKDERAGELLSRHLYQDERKRQKLSPAIRFWASSDADHTTENNRLIVDYMARTQAKRHEPHRQAQRAKQVGALESYQRIRAEESRSGLRGLFERGTPLFSGANRMIAVRTVLQGLQSGQELQEIMKNTHLQRLVGNDRLNHVIDHLL